MAEASIPVDLLNPGQVFACLGFMEVALELEGEVRAGFDWSEPESRFRMHYRRAANPFECVLRFLDRATVISIAPESSSLRTDGWGVSTQVLRGRTSFPIPEPESLATLPAILADEQHEIAVAHWGDGTRRERMKFWGGSQGKPGVAFLQDALKLVRGRLEDAVHAPFDLAAPQKSSFRFDWRRDYISIDAGFSLNEHKSTMSSLGYPVVEVLAAIGLSHARPHCETKLRYRYGVVGRARPDEPEASTFLPPALLRAALGASLNSPFASRAFAMRLGWPGQENQARCITTVTEELR